MEFRARRGFLGPEDAMAMRSRYDGPVSFVGVSCPSMTGEKDGNSRASFLPPPSRRPPLPPSRSHLPPPVSNQGFWDRERLQEEFGRQSAHRRRYSDQDLETRNARATLQKPVAQKHKSANSYPIYSPSSNSQRLSSSTPSPFASVGAPWTMEPRSQNPRPASPSSSITSISRSSFESRMPSPLSRASSFDWNSGVTIEDSSYFDRRLDLLGAKSMIPQTANPTRLDTEPIVPRYGAGGAGRKQIKEAPNIPPRAMLPRQNPYGKVFVPRIKGEGFRKLPEEILLVIIAELRKLHLDTGCLSCATCWMRDVTKLGLTCKKWWGAARIALYEDIQLVGKDSIFHTKKRFKIKYGTRLRLLRRTLRTRPDLAQHVKSLKVPATPDAVKSKKEEDDYLDLVASIVMACPNLERLLGFFAEYDHSFSRLAQALSTRTKMTEKVWVIAPSPFQRQHRYHISDESDTIVPNLAPGPLLPEQCIDFLTYHSNWSNLHTLVMHCTPGGTVDSLLFADIFNSLPSLEHLHVSHFPAPSFNDETLLALPPLKSLRLDHLSGVTTQGLSAYASPERTSVLTSLTLISIPVLSIPLLARLFSHFSALTYFTISQSPSPSLPLGAEIWLYPYFASRTLEHLHWEFTSSTDATATEILAKSIQFNGFPELRTLRAPTDHDGLLQRLCMTRDKIELTADKYRNMGSQQPTQTSVRPGLTHSSTLPNLPSPTRSTFSLGHRSNSSVGSSILKSPTRSTFSINKDQHTSSTTSSSTSDESGHVIRRHKSYSLSLARRQAQARINACLTSPFPQFQIVITSPEGVATEIYNISFLGSINSRIRYTLKPDVEGSDESLFFIGGGDSTGGLLDLGEEIHPRDACTGSWNLDMGGEKVKEKGKKGKDTGGRKGKRDWWHTERGRWKEVPLEKLF